MGTAVADLDGAPEALAQHHQSGVEELINIFVDRWQTLYRIAMRQLENGADAQKRCLKGMSLQSGQCDL